MTMEALGTRELAEPLLPKATQQQLKDLRRQPDLQAFSAKKSRPKWPAPVDTCPAVRTPIAHHEILIDLGANLEKYTQRIQLRTTDRLTMHRPSGVEREATKLGPFPFDCFFNGEKEQGEIIVDPMG